MITHYRFCCLREVPYIREIFNKINLRKSSLMVVVLVHGWMNSTLSKYVWLFCKNKVNGQIWLSSVVVTSFFHHSVIGISSCKHKGPAPSNNSTQDVFRLKQKIVRFALFFSNVIGLRNRVSNKSSDQNVYQGKLTPNNNANAKFYGNETVNYK